MVGTLTRMVRASQNPTSIARSKGLPCPKCNEHHIRKSGKPGCVGHNRFGHPCGMPPIPGGEVCRQRHGGASRQVVAAAQMRLDFAEVEGELAAVLRRVDIPDQHPLDGLLEVVRQSGAMMRMLSLMVADLDIDPIVNWKTEWIGDSSKQIRISENEAIIGFNKDGEQASDIRVQLFEKWARLYMNACKTALDANIDERLVRNATATSDVFFKALKIGLDAAELSVTQSQALTTAIADALRDLNGLAGKVIEG